MTEVSIPSFFVGCLGPFFMMCMAPVGMGFGIQVKVISEA
jgi:hypothetical protein